MFEFLLPKKMRKAARRKRRAPAGAASAPQTWTLDDSGLNFILIRDGFRTLRLTVKPDGSVLVKAPRSAPEDTVMGFVRSRLDWISEKQDFFLRHHGSATEFCEGGTIHFLGRPFRIATVPARRGTKPRLIGDTLELPCRDGSPAEIERAFKAWRLGVAKSVLSRRLTRLDAHARSVLADSSAPSGLALRSLKRRWGSCSVRGEITLAVQLIALPLPLIDYVLCHELCHLRRMDHSPAFYAVLLQLLPDARERAERIRIWSLEHPRT